MNPVAILALVVGALLLRSILRPRRWMRRSRSIVGIGAPWFLRHGRFGLRRRVKLGLLAVGAVLAVQAWQQRRRGR